MSAPFVLSNAVHGAIKFFESVTAENSNQPMIRSPFHSTHLPPMTIRPYCERILRYSKCSDEAFIVGVMLLCKLSFFTNHDISAFNVHRMLITSTLIAAKMRDDEYFANTYYARIGGIRVEELNALELHFLHTCNWDIWIDESAYEAARKTFENLTCEEDADYVLWFHAFKSETLKRQEMQAQRFSEDMSTEGAKYSTTPTTRNPGALVQNSPIAADGSRLPLGKPRTSAFPDRPQQQPRRSSSTTFLVDSASTGSLDALSRVAAVDSDSRDTSGTLGPDPTSREQSPNDAVPQSCTARDEESQQTANASNTRSWANIARSNSRSVSQLRSEDIIDPQTPTSRDEGSFSSQATPTKTLTKTRFQQGRSTGNGIRRNNSGGFVDPTTAVAALRQAPANASAPIEQTAVSLSSEEPSDRRGARKESKKRPKPEHYQDYR
mmetsp:Transcript_27034/g.31211  ORF Transcript_27034/g.31211 Transcript_27034/m.31211 type:complete len:437 (+) Transcript_27034:217-1527(+)